MPVSPARRAAIRRRLLSWYDAAHRRLPWRFPQHAADPYRVWLAEVMLQQTRVETVVPYFSRFVARFPSLEALARASEDDVLALWSGLGYYARGRNLLRAARDAVSRHGALPASLEALLALPGFGPYTAGAVASIAFAIPAPAVDGNVVRVLARLFEVEGAPASPRFRRRVEALAAALVDPDRPGDLNQALMELGATVCERRAPRCPRCPVAPLCGARGSGRAERLPAPRRRSAPRRLVLACAAVRREDGAMLFARRPDGGLFGGLWTLPVAEVAHGDDPRAALALALRREHGVRCRVGDELATCERVLTHRLLTMRAFACDATRVKAGEGLRFAVASDLGELALPTAMRALVERI